MMTEEKAISEHLQGILDTLPEKPGCYLMKDEGGKVIYVGKAVNLRSRVRSYFHKSAQQDGKTRQLVQRIAHIDWIVVGSELEALILEMNLIKKYRPRYNVLLKDDKRYPYIKVHWADAFPKVTITRNMLEDGSRYYGPYTSVWAMHQTLDLLRRVFPYRTCDRDITGKDARACLYHDIKLCTAPCIGAVDQQGYRAVIEDLCQFLEGKTGPIMQRLRAEMDQAAEELRFEQAAILRDRMQAIERVVERQKVISTEQMDSDVIAMARSNGEACVQIFFIRSGKLIGREYFILEGTEDEADSEVMAEFVKQFYEKAPSVPPEVLLPNEIEEARIIQTWLNTRRSGAKVKLRVPRRGKSHDLVEMATENAMETLKSLRAQWEADTNRQTQALAELQQAFGLAEAPNRIECYDISNTQGTASVGSMVVFEQGVPAKGLYRRFNIKTVVGPDDFASMEEVLVRRFRRWEAAQSAQKLEKKPDPSFAMLPDVLIVDGGKGQLGRAVKVLDEFGLTGKIVVAGLAKQEEELFLPGQEAPIILERHSQGLYLVQRVRDEAHRFAITAHRKRRTKIGLASTLDSIPGVGPKRRKALLSRFGSLDAIRSASIEELAEVPGVTLQLAQAVKSQLE
jgi:excinuclease ABC subunit C